jgi:predicted GTPase
MLIFEFDQKQDSAMVTQIVALTNQLQQEIDDGEIDPDNYSVDNLLDYFQEYDIILDVDDLYTMIKVPPLQDVVTNIQGDKVVFKGHQGDTAKKPHGGDSEKTVQQMAKRAMKT